jgi:hypothetical protein
MRVVVFVVLFMAASTASAGNLGDVEKSLARIKAVSKEGAGNQEASAAWKDLVSQGGEALFPTLSALDDASPTAANWLVSAVNTLAEKEQAAGRKLPVDKLEAFLKDVKHAPMSRRLAYELLAEADPKAPERLLPGLLNDASGPIRRDAIAAALTKAEKLEGEPAKKEYTRLFAFVRDQDQADKIVKVLDKHGAKPDLIGQFGIIANWHVVAPFDSTKGIGFAKVYEPEKKVDLSVSYKGKNDAEVKWKPFASTDPYGVVDLNKALEKYKDAVAYAFTIVESEKEQPVEIRFGCIAAIKVFLNGKELFAREEYHHGDRFDQYMVPATLKAGKNEFLVKVCQNNQTEPWAQVWQFQLRICDATGGAVPVKVAK